MFDVEYPSQGDTFMMCISDSFMAKQKARKVSDVKNEQVIKESF